MKIKYIFMGIFITSLLVTGATAQDASLLKFADGDSWEFEVTSGEFEYTADGGTVSEGETYVFEVTSDVSDTGSYDFTYDGPDGKATGTEQADDFGSDAIYADWDYWEDNAPTDIVLKFGIFGPEDVTIVNGDEIFTANVSILDTIDLEISYYKATGVLFKLGITSDLIADFVIENITGAVADESGLPGFEFTIGFIGLLVVVPIIRRMRS